MLLELKSQEMMRGYIRTLTDRASYQCFLAFSS